MRCFEASDMVLPLFHAGVPLGLPGPDFPGSLAWSHICKVGLQPVMRKMESKTVFVDMLLPLFHAGVPLGLPGPDLPQSLA